MLCKNIHIRFSTVYLSICPVALSVFLSYSLKTNSLCGLLTVTEAHVKGTPPPLSLSPHPQATDEDSPPNNVLTYSITSVSAFPNYFRIIMVEGYAGMLMFEQTSHNIGRDVVDVLTS